MEQPAWATRLFDTFLEAIKWISIKPQAGGNWFSPPHKIFACKCHLVDEGWEVAISPWRHEIYGGKMDGASIRPTYEVDLLMLADEFDVVKYIGFDTTKLQANIEGIIDNSLVNLVFYQESPSPIAKKRINTFTGEITNIEK